jgi:hypothetical protein
MTLHSNDNGPSWEGFRSLKFLWMFGNIYQLLYYKVRTFNHCLDTISYYLLYLFFDIAEFLIAQLIKMNFFNDGSLRICRAFSHLFGKSQTFPGDYKKYLRWGNPTCINIFRTAYTFLYPIFVRFHCETCVTGACLDPLQCLQFKMILYICLVNVYTEKYIIEFKLCLPFLHVIQRIEPFWKKFFL